MLPLPCSSLTKPVMPAAPNFSPTVSIWTASLDETRSFTATTTMPAFLAEAIVALRPVSEFESRMIASTCWAIMPSTAAIWAATLVPALLMISFLILPLLAGRAAKALASAASCTRAALP